MSNKRQPSNTATASTGSIAWLSSISMNDLDTVGGKGASLGEMYQHLTKRGVRVPNAFAVTTKGYHYFLDFNNATDQLQKKLDCINAKEKDNLAENAKDVRKFIRGLKVPPDLGKEITTAYHKLSQEYSTGGKEEEEGTDVAIRSSATAEDLPGASFAGQLKSYLNVRGPDNLLIAVRKCFASLFTKRAIIYRERNKIDFRTVAISVCIQKMVRSDLSTSGVMFTIDTESGNPDIIVINAAYGLGENVVQGAINPDEYRVFKRTLNKLCQDSSKGFRPIISKKIGSKARKLMYAENGGVDNIPVPKNLRRALCLTDDEVLELARWGCQIEDHYGHAVDIEWAKDGQLNQMFIVQSRAETVHSKEAPKMYRKYIIDYSAVHPESIILKGNSVGSRIGSGKACVIPNISEIERFIPGSVLVTDMTDPDWVSIMSQASAIVTNSGGRTCHAAIVSRELGLSCVVGTRYATEKIKPGMEVTVDCSRGLEGFVYSGLIPFRVEETDITTIPDTKTKMMMIVGDPEKAFEFSRIPCQGVGLVRIEFIISDSIKIHPLALVNYPNFDDPSKSEEENGKTRRIIDKLTAGYENKSDYFVDKLAQGIGQVASAFYPREVIVRTSDFKTNEYANLLGGQRYEPSEENPMLGWRGASRYYDPNFEPGFRLECLALRKVREEFGRTIEEAELVMQTLAKYKIEKKEGLKIYAMCEIPSNVLLAKEFLRDDLFDGFSIGSNDLTQLVLGLDRDSGTLSHIGNELHSSVKSMISLAISETTKLGKYIGICGQGPSDFPDFARWLVRAGIHSISLNPDTMLETWMVVAKEEEAMRCE